MPGDAAIPVLLSCAAISVAVAAATCAHAQAIPDADQPQFAFEEYVELGGFKKVGRTALGERNMVPISGGTVSGLGIKGRILPGGWDWQLVRNDGCLEIKADYMIQTDDDVLINVINRAVSCPEGNGRPQSGRSVALFEAPIGKYDWLSKASFVGTIRRPTDPAQGGIVIRFYRLI